MKRFVVPVLRLGPHPCVHACMCAQTAEFMFAATGTLPLAELYSPLHRLMGAGHIAVAASFWALRVRRGICCSCRPATASWDLAVFICSGAQCCCPCTWTLQTCGTVVRCMQH